ncbi:hypothetical protein JZ751_021341 [Albula glossodonta]|uniref:Uncharacterized protein n=1 Tax=Albula glossodonta TaxID=121402 RepID=A0A8T2NN80_9TELE|nr:hypothetical protein JZ751_021341 [Albula glossodonta]
MPKASQNFRQCNRNRDENGVVPMMGLKSLQSCKGSQQVYSVLSRPGASAEARLLTTSSQSPSDMVCAPPFAGIMNICESYGDCLGNQAPMAIPACPAPQIPEGLKQRFQPFGSKTPSGHGPKAPEQQEETTDSPMLAKRVKPDPEESGGPKKKKKKDKRTKAEKVEEVEEEISAALSHSLTEEAQETSQELSAPGEEVVEKKKKKKKSKDKSREERTGRAETHFSFKEEVEVKTEPMDFAYGDVESSGKKKKMKKEKKRLDD